MAQVLHGFEGEIKKDTSTVALCSSVSVEIEPNIDGVNELGNRKVVEWKAGNLEVSGSIEKMWYDHTFATEVSGSDPTTFTLKFNTTDEDAVTKTVECTGVVFTSWSRDLPEDGFVTESIDFQAKDINLT